MCTNREDESTLSCDTHTLSVRGFSLYLHAGGSMPWCTQVIRSTIFHILNLFSKIQNKENKYMYTNTIKIEYVLYKISTAVLRVKASPIWSFCP